MDAGTRLLLAHSLNKELHRHRCREGKVYIERGCGAECERVMHDIVLWECPAYSSCRLMFLKKLQELLEDKYTDFVSLII